MLQAARNWDRAQIALEDPALEHFVYATIVRTPVHSSRYCALLSSSSFPLFLTCSSILYRLSFGSLKRSPSVLRVWPFARRLHKSINPCTSSSDRHDVLRSIETCLEHQFLPYRATANCRKLGQGREYSMEEPPLNIPSMSSSLYPHQHTLSLFLSRPHASPFSSVSQLNVDNDCDRNHHSFFTNFFRTQKPLAFDE